VAVGDPMSKALLKVKEAQAILFGTDTLTDYHKTLRLIHSKQIEDVLEDGGGYLIPRAQIVRFLGKEI